MTQSQTPTDRPQISVVVPMYNEVDNVQPLLEEIRTALTPWAEFEMVIVDDYSTDATLNKLLELKQSMPELRVIQHQRNLGQSAAVVNGVYAARFKLVATLDGDGQNNPADIIHLYTAFKTNQNALIAGHRQKRNDSVIRLLSSRVANLARKNLLKDSCADSGCGLKMFPRDNFLRLPHFKHLHRFLPALFIRQGAIVINVPVSHRARLRGQSKYGVMNRLWVGIVDLFGVSWLIRRPCPTELSREL